jgi:hypothetical protein
VLVIDHRELATCAGRHIPQSIGPAVEAACPDANPNLISDRGHH